MDRRDYFKRYNCITDKAKQNDLVFLLTVKHYKEIVQLSRKNIDIFQTTFLWMTANYNPDLDFVEEFTREFNSLYGEFTREEKVVRAVFDRNALDYANNQFSKKLGQETE